MKGITRPELKEKLGKPEALYISKNYRAVGYKHDRPLVFCEKVGADFYHYLSDNSFENPKVRFNISYYENSKEVYSVNICSKYNKDFILFGKDNKPRISPDGDVKIKNPDNTEELIKIQGYLRMLAIGQFLGDWDVVGSEGDNAGFIFDQQNKIAKCMKIDPGMSFSGPRGSYEQFPRSKIYEIISSEELLKLKNNPENYLELANAVYDIVNLTDEEIFLLIKGDNENRRFDTIPFQDTYLTRKENPQEALKDYQDNLAKVMIARRNHMKEFYNTMIYQELKDLNSQFAKDASTLKDEAKKVDGDIPKPQEKVEKISDPELKKALEQQQKLVEQQKKIQVDVGQYKTKFDNLLNQLAEVRDSLKEKARSNSNYKEVATKVSGLHSTLKQEMEQFFATPTAEGFKQCHQICNQEITTTMAESAKHRGWHDVHPIIRGIVGVLATIAVIPALIVAATSKHGYAKSFFATPETTSTAEKITSFKENFKDQKNEFEGQDNEVSLTLKKIKI